ncbi:DUF3153 domain-containing protein [Chamaesiphon sp. OTE_8_metabat_110]|uniref:DUF3153 domain-containing protein n=1 Tax=Chamaesiphon sp. OTE_8_metabat_110 TaxID=2964696 RepID=UPI00286AF24F|nr:DUF3153 domain-containing protein [Chamaesiphon sp. OTE_8_metabat_110]
MNTIAIVDKIGRFTAWLLKLIRQKLALGFLAIAISLSGCVRYDTGIHFSSLSDGEIVAHIQLSEQLTSFSQNAVKTWLASIEQRTLAAQGHLERLSDREFKAIIPFNNPQELVTKINRYFSTDSPSSETSLLKAVMKIDRQNFLVVIRNHLIYDLDLRSLAVTPPNRGDNLTPKVAIGMNKLVDLDLTVQSPWGIKNIKADGNNIGMTVDSQQMKWQLQPGRLNHIDAVFWLPNPLGVGAIAIVLIGITGYYMKYRQLPWQLVVK